MTNDDHHGTTVQSASSVGSNERLSDLEHRNTAQDLSNHNDSPFTIPSVRFTKGNNSPFMFNQLDSSQELSQPFKEPKFCSLLTPARGLFCGYVSLKWALISIALVDITLGGAALGIGITAFLRLHLHLSLIAFVLMNSASFVLALFSLVMIAKNNQRGLGFYLIWKMCEVVCIPIFEIIILTVTVQDPSTDLKLTQSINYYVFIGLKSLARLFFAYIIYSYKYRRDLGEHLLVEYGEKKLSRMIDQISRDQ